MLSDYWEVLLGLQYSFFYRATVPMESEQKRTLNFWAIYKETFNKAILTSITGFTSLGVYSCFIGELSISWSIVTKIFIGFEDNVLWFIKDLIALYLLFGGLKHIILTNKTDRMVLLF